MKNAIIALLLVFSSSLYAAEVVEKQALVCRDADNNIYGIAMTRYRTAHTDDWSATLFTEKNLEQYQRGMSYFDMNSISASTDYNGSSSEFTATDDDGKSIRLYSCTQLSYLDRIFGEREWYKFLNGYQN